MSSSEAARPLPAGRVRLTTDGKRKSAPVFVSPQEIVFAVHEVPNRVVLKRLRLPGGAQELVHPSQSAHQLDPAYSPDGRYHAFALSANSPQLVLVIQDKEEKTEATFRPREARAVVRSPCFSPDGRRVVFSLSDVGGYQIASVDVRAKDQKTLTASAGVNTSPAFSPDGRKIAFCSSRDSDLEIYMMDADGSNVVRRTHSPGIDTRPAWSADGRQIAFTSNRDGEYAIYVMNADGSGVRRLSPPGGPDDYAAWHADGKQLLVVSERDGKSDLYLIPVGPSSVRN
jgi:TolB protein